MFYLLNGVKANYYRDSKGQVVKVFSVHLNAYEHSGGRQIAPYFEAVIVTEVNQRGFKSFGEVRIPLLEAKLREYKRASDVELEALRVPKSELATKVI